MAVGHEPIHEVAGLHFIEVWVDTPVEECERRDPKGLYERARRGEISDMTGVNAAYEVPERPELVASAAPGSEALLEAIGGLLP